MHGIKRTVRLLVAMMAAASPAITDESPSESEEAKVKPILNFENTGDDWQIIDDGVMGGRSEGTWSVADGIGVFEGMLSLENNGGFSSVRSQALSNAWDGARAFRLRVRGDGRTYQFRVRTSAAFDGASYRLEFPTKAGEWQEFTLPLDKFEASFRGRVLSDYPPLVGEDIVTIGFLLADKEAGSFRLEVDRIGIAQEKGNGTEPTVRPD